MLRLVLFVCALLVIGCDPQPNTDQSTSGVPVYYWHDEAHGVSCWLYGGTGNVGKGISCLADSQLGRTP